jgi:hypothetical protein
MPIGGWTNKQKFDAPFIILPILGLDIPEKSGNWVIGFSANQYFYVPKHPSTEHVQATPFILVLEGIGAFLRFHYAPEDWSIFNVFVSGGISRPRGHPDTSPRSPWHRLLRAPPVR